MKANTTSATTPRTAGTTSCHCVRPVPTSGGRSVASPRNGNARPRTTSTTMMIRNGTDAAQPERSVSGPSRTCRYAISDCRIPMSRPPNRVSQNDLKLPTSAAASAGTMSRVSVITWSPLRFTIRIAASTPSIVPIAQFNAAMRSGEIPCAAVARLLSATAVVAKPKRV